MTQAPLPLATAGPSPFDAIRREDAEGEHWHARELMPLLGYDKWERFDHAIERAITAIANTGEDAARHASRRREMVSGVPGAARTDYRLTRYGAYMTAMNGDPRKAEIAAAQMYFAIKTREAETGGTAHGLPTTFAEALRLAADQAEAIEKQNREIASLEPRAAQADHYREADGLYAVASFANDLQAWARETHDAKILHDDVRDFLGEIGLIIRGDTVRNNEPKAEALKAGYVRQKHTTYDTKTRGTKTTTTARLTPKGWGYAWDKAVTRITDHGDLKPTRAIEEASR